jgi:hypothetical protein
MTRKTGRSTPNNPETELEQERFDAALRRKQLSLVLAEKWNQKMLQNWRRCSCKKEFETVFFANLGLKKT